MSKLVVIAALLVGCGKGTSKPEPSEKPASVEMKPHEHAGVRFTAPSDASSEDVGDANTKVIKGKRYRVTIEKVPTKQGFASFKEIIETEPGASNVTGRETDRGWELRYASSVTAGAASRTVYMNYVSFGESDHYQCRFDDEESDVATASAICSSITKK